MFRVMVMIKRKCDMSMADFINYYETKHAPLGASRVPNSKRYVRHFIRPYGNDIYSADAEPTYDVLAEIWFDDEADFQHGMAYLSEPETAAIIGADEEQLFEKSSIRFMIMEDHDHGRSRDQGAGVGHRLASVKAGIIRANQRRHQGVRSRGPMAA